MRKALTFFTLITVAALLSGCMKVVSTNPANGATGVDRNAIIKVTFNMEANPVTVNSGTFLVKDSLNTPVDGTVSYSKQVATFTPQSDLAPSMDFIVTIKADVRNKYGQTLGSDYSFHFTTRDRTWGIAELIDTDNAGDSGYPGYPHVAIDPDGNAIAVWDRNDGTRDNIWANRYTPASGWGTAGLIETENAGDAWYPHVAIDPDGNAIAVWNQSGDIWANRYTPASGWGTAELIETDNAGSAGIPHVAIDPDGNAIAVWTQSDGTLYSIWANWYTPASGWGTAELIETDNAGDVRYLHVAIDPDGNAIAVWGRNYGGWNCNVWANRYTPASGWGTAEILDTRDTRADEPQVAIDPDGNAIVVWTQHDGYKESIWANRYTPASGWGTAELIERDNAGDAWEPQVAMDPDGNAIAIWCLLDEYGRTRICANRYIPGSGWGMPDLIEINAGNKDYPQIAINLDGNAIAVWEQSDGTRWNIWANRYTPESGWGKTGPIEGNTGDAQEPQIAMDPDGNAIAVWRQSDGTRWNIWANRFE